MNKHDISLQSEHLIDDVREKFISHIQIAKNLKLLDSSKLDEFERKYRDILDAERRANKDVANLQQITDISLLNSRLYIEINKNLTDEKIKHVMQYLHHTPEIDLNTEVAKTATYLNHRNNEIRNFFQLILLSNTTLNRHYNNELADLITKKNEIVKEINSTENKEKVFPEAIQLSKKMDEKINQLSEKIKLNTSEINKKISTDEYAYTKTPNHQKFDKALQALAEIYFNALRAYLKEQLSATFPDNDPHSPDGKAKIEKQFPGLNYTIKEEQGHYTVNVSFKNPEEVKSLGQIIHHMKHCMSESNRLIEDEKSNFFGRVISAFSGKKPIEYLNNAINDSVASSDFSAKKLLNITHNETYSLEINHNYFDTIKHSLIVIHQPQDQAATTAFSSTRNRHENIASDLDNIQHDFKKLTSAFESESPKNLLNDAQKQMLIDFLTRQQERMNDDKRFFISSEKTQSKLQQIDGYLNRLRDNKPITAHIVDELAKDSILNASRTKKIFSFLSGKETVYAQLLKSVIDNDLELKPTANNVRSNTPHK